MDDDIQPAAPAAPPLPPAPSGAMSRPGMRVTPSVTAGELEREYERHMSVEEYLGLRDAAPHGLAPADGHWAEDCEAYSALWDEIDLELNPCPYCASDCAGCARAGEPTEPVPADELRRRFQARLRERLLARLPCPLAPGEPCPLARSSMRG